MQRLYLIISNCFLLPVLLFASVVSGCDWWPDGVWPKETYAGPSMDSYMGIKVGMTEEQVLKNAYQDNSPFGCIGGEKYEKRKWSPSVEIVKDNGRLYWIELNLEGKEITKTPIQDSQINKNSFFKKLGYQYPTKTIENKVLVFQGYPYAYVYFDEENKVIAIFTGGS